MKKLMITAALFAGLISIGFAQQETFKVKKTPEQRAQHITEVLEKKLALTADQKVKVYEINLERAKKMDKIHTANQIEKQRQTDKRKDLLKDSNDKLDRILNEDQRRLYQEMKTKMEGHHKGKSEGQKMKRKKL